MYVVLPANHWLWYVAQILLGMSFVATSLIVLRGLLACGFLLLLIWSIVELKVSVDSAVFSGVYMLINFFIMCKLLYARRHVQFDAQREELYTSLFSSANDLKDHTGVLVPQFNQGKEQRESEARMGATLKSRRWHCTRVTWLRLMENSSIITLEAGAVVASPGDHCEHLSFLLDGEISYHRSANNSNNNKVRRHVHSVNRLGVIDAVEWVNRWTPRGAIWGISVTAQSKVQLLRIPFKTIDAAAAEDPMAQIQQLFDAICGVQVTLMLFDTQHQAQVQSTLIDNSGDRRIKDEEGDKSANMDDMRVGQPVTFHIED